MNLEDVKSLASRELSGDKHKSAIHYLNLITSERDLLSVDKLKVGDTFFYKVTGGKSRPWVVLWVKKGSCRRCHTNSPYDTKPLIPHKV